MASSPAIFCAAPLPPASDRLAPWPRFHLHFVASGRLSRAQGETLRHAFELRQHADYDAFTVFDEAATADLMADVEAFVEAVATLLAP